MHTTINQETTVREEQRGGDRWLIAEDVAIIRPQVLSNGYVPEDAIQRSLSQQNTHGETGWSGVAVTLNHPRNLPEFSWYDPSEPRGQPVLAANDQVQDTLGLGHVENPSFDGEAIRADVAINADQAERMGGEATGVVNAMETGDPLDVSTQYVGAELPPGEYDGEHRAKAEAIVAPDSLAVLPNQDGQCSVEDGCGVHADLATANGVGLTLNAAHTPDDPGTTPSSVETGEDSGTWADAVANVLASLIERRPDAPEQHPTLDTDELSLPPAVTGDDAAEDDDEASANSEQTTGAATAGEADTPAETFEESTMDRDTLITEITENSEIQRESLDGMGDTCLETTHSHVVGNADEGPDADEADADDETDTEDDETETVTDETDETDIGTDADQVVVVDKDELESLITSEVEERVAANRERQQKAERVDTIVANSAEHGEDDRDDLMKTPDSVLSRIERSLDAGIELPGASSPDVAAQSETGNAEDYSPGVLD